MPRISILKTKKKNCKPENFNDFDLCSHSYRLHVKFIAVGQISIIVFRLIIVHFYHARFDIDSKLSASMRGIQGLVNLKYSIESVVYRRCY